MVKSFLVIYMMTVMVMLMTMILIKMDKTNENQCSIVNIHQNPNQNVKKIGKKEQKIYYLILR